MFAVSLPIGSHLASTFERKKDESSFWPYSTAVATRPSGSTGPENRSINCRRPSNPHCRRLKLASPRVLQLNPRKYRANRTTGCVPMGSAAPNSSGQTLLKKSPVPFLISCSDGRRIGRIKRLDTKRVAWNRIRAILERRDQRRSGGASYGGDYSPGFQTCSNGTIHGQGAHRRHRLGGNRADGRRCRSNVHP